MNIVVPVCNNPTFIRIQVASFRKYISEPYEFIVFNDAKSWPDFSNFGDPKMPERIRAVCRELDLTCIDIPNDSHRTELLNASERHAHVMNYIYEWMGPNEYFVFDSDMFLIAPLDLVSYRSHALAYVPQYREAVGTYIWPNLFYIDTRRIPHPKALNFGLVPGGDSGSASAAWLQMVDQPHLYVIPRLPSLNWDYNHVPVTVGDRLRAFLDKDPRNRNGNYYCEIYDNAILHYRAGSNWERRSPGLHAQLTASLQKALDLN